MSEHRLTLLLRQWADGDGGAAAELMEATYDQLRRTARGLLRNERNALQATELVHEAFLRLFHGAPVSPETRASFFKLMAVQMRRQLVDDARRRGALKRGDGEVLGLPAVTSSDVAVDRLLGAEELFVVDDALRRLDAVHPRAARVMMERVFAGRTIEETAVALAVSPGTVKREFAFARAWLRRELETS